MGVMLSSPVELTRVQRKGSPSFRAAVAEMQGWRTNHEDAHAMYCDDKWGSFWVLDGHGGDGASMYCAPRLSDLIGEVPKDAEIPEDHLICMGFEGIDQEFRDRVANHPNEDSGSTVIGSIVAKQKDGTYTLKLLNAGDSRGMVIAGPEEKESDKSKVVVKGPAHLGPIPANWPVLTSTVDHKPDFPSEKERIEKAGGFVSQDDPPRLDGNLAVSRGLGDFEYKTSNEKPASEQKVSCIPDIYEVSGLRDGSVCLLACDGLWDVLTVEQVAEIVRGHLKRKRTADLGVICAELVHKALQENSRDNITVMIIQLTDGSDWACNSSKFNGSDEMMHFDKLVGDTGMDDELRKQYLQFLRRCRFLTTPVQCAVSGRWFHSMWRCPGTGNVYINRHCQKKGWARHKNGGKEPLTNGAKAKAPVPAGEEEDSW